VVRRIETKSAALGWGAVVLLSRRSVSLRSSTKLHPRLVEDEAANADDGAVRALHVDEAQYSTARRAVKRYR
jgi:hypothetical protein